MRTPCSIPPERRPHFPPQPRLYCRNHRGRTKAREYLLSVLVDPISQECTEQNAPILEGALFTIDYGMKAGALDLEKEAILQNYRGRRNMGFTMDGLKITQRVYVFGQGDKETLAARFAKDVCNPAIHNWTIA